MSMIISLGSNIGDCQLNLKRAKWILSSRYELIAKSSIYTSKAVDNTNQPDFLNQLLEFEMPSECPDEIMRTMLSIEEILGRVRLIEKGPRTIDLDVIFLGTQRIKTDMIEVPHPRWSERSFIIYPLKELPFFEKLSGQFSVPSEISNTAQVVS